MPVWGQGRLRMLLGHAMRWLSITYSIRGGGFSPGRQGGGRYGNVKGSINYFVFFMRGGERGGALRTRKIRSRVLFFYRFTSPLNVGKKTSQLVLCIRKKHCWKKG